MGRGKKFGFSFSAKRASGLSAAKGRVSRATGIPLSKSGRQRKIGREVGCCIPLALFAVIVFVAAGTLHPIRSAVGQVRGTFSADAARGMGTGRHSTIPALDSLPPNLMLADDTLDEWFAGHETAVRNLLAAARRARINPNANQPDISFWEKSQTYIFRRREDKESEIRRLETELLSPSLPRISTLAPAIGHIGSLGRCRVIQILDGTTCLASATARGSSGDWTFFLKGAVVGNLREGLEVEAIPGAWRVAGKRTYTTALGGLSTVHVLEEFTPAAREAATLALPDKVPVSPAPQWRTWQSADGKYTVEAKFVKGIGDTVHLEKKDGSIITIQRGKLSEDDRDWITRKQ